MIIGLDVGGTKIAGGIIEKGKVIERFEVPTYASKGKVTVVKQLAVLIKKLAKNKKINGIGIGVPGTFQGTKIVMLPNVTCLNGVDIKKELRLTCPVVLENDARCFALGEQRYGAGKGSKNMLGVILGTGVGSGVIINGKLYTGSTGKAGEIGNILLDTNKVHHSMDLNHGKWETLLAGPGIMQRHQMRGGSESSVSEMWASTTHAAQVTREETIRHLCIFFASLQYAFDPDVIVVGGGVSNAPFFDEVNSRMERYGVRPIVKKNILGQDAPILGAAASLL